MEYYILTENKKVIGVFESLLLCLSWKPNRILQEPIEVQKVCLTDKGEFKTQNISINKEIFNFNYGK